MVNVREILRPCECEKTFLSQFHCSVHHRTHRGGGILSMWSMWETLLPTLIVHQRKHTEQILPAWKTQNALLLENPRQQERTEWQKAFGLQNHSFLLHLQLVSFLASWCSKEYWVQPVEWEEKRRWPLPSLTPKPLPHNSLWLLSL